MEYESSPSVTLPDRGMAATNTTTSNSPSASMRHRGENIICPVVGCPLASPPSLKSFRDFASIRKHLNDHCTGNLSGAVPVSFLAKYKFSQCNVCDKIITIRYHGTCPGCRPNAHLRAQMDLMRRRNNASNNNSPPNAPESTPVQVQEPVALPSFADISEKWVLTIRNIPTVLRRLWAQCLVKSLAKVVWENNEASWKELMMLPKCTLCRPVRSGKSHKKHKEAWTRGKLQRWLAGERGELWRDIPPCKRPQPKPQSTEAAKANRQERCISLTSEGGYSNACKALVSSPPLTHTADVTKKLIEKHPSSNHPVSLGMFGNASSSLVPISDVESIEGCIRSFHRLSGGGPSGLKPIHLKNSLTTEHRDEVLEKCSSLVNILAKGEAPDYLAPFLAGAALTALPKKDNGLRPVAVGEVWRRLTAKFLCKAYKGESSEFFFPQQIGVGQPLGTEIGLETARQWCKRNSENSSSVIVKIDFTNAFNCVERQVLLEQCRHHFPGLSRWAEWCYSKPSHLYFGPEVILSERGVQQGDPIGPLLFSLALQPILLKLHNARSEEGLQLSYSFLDDLVLAGDQSVVSEAFMFVKAEASKIGLQFNTSKCEVIPAAGHGSRLNKSLFPDNVIYREDGNFELLGGPIGSNDFCNAHTQERVNTAMEILNALGELPDPQVALTLLRHCASFGKLVYSIRVVPHHKHLDALSFYDNSVRDCMESILCSSFSDTEWSLATLSTKLGGLGLRSVEHHSSAAFISSQVACHKFCVELDPKYKWDPTDSQADIVIALNDFNSKVCTENQLPTNIDPCPRQQQLSQAIDNKSYNGIKEKSINNVYQKAHLNLTSTSAAGSWLHIVPAKALGTHVDPLLYQVMIQRWLRSPIYETEFHCPFCDEVVDRYADHCLICAFGGDRIKRHNLIRNEVYYFCNGAGLNPELERPGILQQRLLVGASYENGGNRDPNSNRRPADVYLPKWRRGNPAALDFAITSGLRSDIVLRSAEDGTIATKVYENTKRSHLDTEVLCREQGITFIPIIGEADGGGWGPEAHKCWNELAKQKAIISGEQVPTVVSKLLQSLGLIIHRENARSILRRSPNGVGRDCSELLAAAAACTTTFDT